MRTSHKSKLESRSHWHSRKTSSTKSPTPSSWEDQKTVDAASMSMALASSLAHPFFDCFSGCDDPDDPCNQVAAVLLLAMAVATEKNVVVVLLVVQPTASAVLGTWCNQRPLLFCWWYNQLVQLAQPIPSPERRGHTTSQRQATPFLMAPLESELELGASSSPTAADGLADAATSDAGEAIPIQS